MRKLAYEQSISREDGRILPLAFVYDDTAFYFDVDGYDDAATTIEVKEGQTIMGIEANRDLVASIQRYGEKRGKVFIAKFFADCVANELSES